MAKKPKRTERGSGDASQRPFAKLGERAARVATPPAAPSTAVQAKGKPAAPREAPPEEAPSFAAIMRGVSELEVKARRLPKRAAAPEPGAPVADLTVDLDAAARERLVELSTGGQRFEVLDDGDHLEGRRLDVDPRVLRRLRRGEVHPDGKLDLHGMSAAEARRAVEAFVSKRSSEGDRAVLIVHGRGGHSPGGRGVLRGEIAAWLSQGAVKRFVAGFASQRDADGGSGSVLVLFERSRQR
jgi:DNA-nicking Smr family endonuclease